MARRIQCPWTAKAIFFTHKDANRTAKRFSRHGPKMKAYKCKKCDHFHLYTTKKKREKPDESLPNRASD